MGVFPFRPDLRGDAPPRGAREHSRDTGAFSMNTTAAAPTKNERLLAWVEEVAMR